MNRVGHSNPQFFLVHHSLLLRPPLDFVLLSGNSLEYHRSAI